MPDEALDKLKEARKKIEDLTAQIPGAFDAERRRIEEAARVRNDRQKEELKDRFEHSPRPIETQIDIEFRQDGRIVPESMRRLIRKWDDGYGNMIFTGADIPIDIDKIRELSIRINAQKDSFVTLPDEEKTKIQVDFDSSPGKSTTSKPYSDFLRSEALGRRFQELKDNPPNPFGKKP